MTEFENIYTWKMDSLAIVSRYFALAGIAYVFFYSWNQKVLSRFKIQTPNPVPSVVRLEVFYSILTLMIYCLISFIVFQFEAAGKTRIYRDFNRYGSGYFVVSILIMVIAHDTYFYWTHRLMHTPCIFRRVHKTHHRSTNPTPWASFAFHPGEAIIAAGIIPFIVFFIPCHPLALFSFLTFMTIVSVMGHLGYEVFPTRFMKSKIGRWQNSSTHHNIHHQHSKCNYGLYFTFWDNLMDTSLEKESTTSNEHVPQDHH